MKFFTSIGAKIDSLWPHDSPKFPKETEPKPNETEPNLSIKIDEQFDKSKRNLLWHTTLSILIGSAALMNQDGACFTFLMVGNFSLPPAFISALLLVYGGYIWWMYEYQLKRVLARNTSQIHKSAEKVFHKEISNITTKIKNVRSLLEAFNQLKVESTRDTINKINKLGNDFTADRPRPDYANFRDGLWEKLLAFEAQIKRNPANQGTGLVEKYNETILAQTRELVFKPVEISERRLLQLQSDISFPQDEIIQNERFFQGSTANLAKMEKTISELAKSVGSLSGDIRKADKQKFKFADEFVPRFMVTVALVLLALTTVQPIFAPDQSHLTCKNPEKTN